MDFNPVHSLAAAFITSRPISNVALPFKPLPALTLAPGNYKAGSPLSFVIKKGLSHIRRGYAVFLVAGGPVHVHAKYAGYDTFKTTIPATVSGQTYVVLQYGNFKVDGPTILLGPAVFEPAVIYH